MVLVGAGTAAGQEPSEDEPEAGDAAWLVVVPTVGATPEEPVFETLEPALAALEPEPALALPEPDVEPEATLEAALEEEPELAEHGAMQ